MAKIMKGKKNNNKTNKCKSNMLRFQNIMGQRFTINTQPGMWVALSISKGVKSVPNEIALAGERLLILARATQSRLEIVKNTRTLLLCHK